MVPASRVTVELRIGDRGRCDLDMLYQLRLGTLFRPARRWYRDIDRGDGAAVLVDDRRGDRNVAHHGLVHDDGIAALGGDANALQERLRISQRERRDARAACA